MRCAVKIFGLVTLVITSLCSDLQAMEKQPEPVTIVAQGVPLPRSTDISSIATRKLLQRFNEKYPYIQIKPFVMPSIAGATMDSGPLMAIAAGIPPTAIYVNFRQSSTYIKRGFLGPLEELLARNLSADQRVRQTDSSGRWLANPSKEEVANALDLIRERVPAPAWPVVYRSGFSGDQTKHVWALPYTNMVMAMLYRKDLFVEAGLDPTRPPKNWDELLSYSRALTVPERLQYGMGFGNDLSYSSYTFLVSNGGRAVQETADGKWEAVYNSPQAAQAYTFLWELLRGRFTKNGKVIQGAALVSGEADLGMKWRRGEIGMMFGYMQEDLLATINPQLVGIATVPVSPSGFSASEVNAKMLGVFSDSTPQQQLAVMELIWFLTGPEADNIRTQIFVESGYGPFVNPMLLKRYGYERILRRVPKGWQEAFDQAMSKGIPEPYGRDTQNVYRYMTRPISEMLEMDFEGVPEKDRQATVLKLLDQSTNAFNVKVLGNVLPVEMRQRRIVATIALIIVALTFIIGFISVWQYITKAGRSAGDPPRMRKVIWGYVVIAPAMLLVIGWSYLPLAGSAIMSLLDYQLVVKSAFVGIDNFAASLYDDQFWMSFLRTFYFVALTMVLGFWPPVLLAVLLDEVPTGFLKYLFRTLFYLPAIISGVIIMFLWKQLFDPSQSGPLNSIILSLNQLGPATATVVKLGLAALWVSFVYLLVRLPFKLSEASWAIRFSLWAIAGVLIVGSIWPLMGRDGSIGDNFAGVLFGQFHIEPLQFLRSSGMAMLCCVLPSVWAASGPGCLLYLAALKTVPADLYEAADIDGAGNWHKVFYITLPRLKFLILIQLMAAVVGAFKGGGSFILAMTGGGPNDSTMVIALEIFMRAFMELDFGLAAAMAWLLGAVLIGFTVWQMRMLSKAEFKAGGR